LDSDLRELILEALQYAEESYDRRAAMSYKVLSLDKAQKLSREKKSNFARAKEWIRSQQQ
jgi:hypothetical protein